jgi:hypothetical protein
MGEYMTDQSLVINPIIKILNKHHGYEPDGDRNYYIGRPSALGNPFPVQGPAYRRACIAAYERYLRQKIANQDPIVCEALNHIVERAITGGINLICFCVPERCHGDVIKKIVLETLKEAGYVFPGSTNS